MRVPSAASAADGRAGRQSGASCEHLRPRPSCGGRAAADAVGAGAERRVRKKVAPMDSEKRG